MNNEQRKIPVTMKKTGEGYPNCIPGMHGWQYVVESENGIKGFAKHSMARAFADRISSMIKKDGGR